MKRLSLAVFLMLLSYQPIWAITMFQFKTQDVSESKTEQLSIAADVDNRRLKLAPDATTTVIYRGDLPEKVMLIVDHEEKETRILDRKQMQAISSQMQQMMQQMQAQMKNLPPEMQKRFAQMQMNKQPMPGQEAMGPKPTIKKTNNRDTVAKLPCTIYEIHADQDMTEVCATSWKKIKNGQASFALFQEMLTFQREMMQAMTSGMPKMGNRPKGMEQPLMMGMDLKQGFPVRIKHFENGQLMYTGELQSVKEIADVAPHYYDSPYETRPMMDGRRR